MSYINYACPLCEQAGKPGVRLMVAFGKMGVFCPNDHMFSDTEEFNAMKKTLMEPVPMPKPVDTTPRTSLTVMVADRAVTNLRAKFKDNYEACIVSALQDLSNEKAFVFPDEDVRRIYDNWQKKVTDAGSVVGLIFSLTEELRIANEEVKAARQSAGTAATPVGANECELKIRMPMHVYKSIEEKARFSAQGPDKFTSDLIQHAATNGWF